MRICEAEGGFALYKEKDIIGRCSAVPTAGGAALGGLWVAPAWRRRGYGSYLLKEVLRRFGGYETGRATVFTAPLPCGDDAAGELAFWAKFGFTATDSGLVRRRVPDLTAVSFVQDFLAAHLGGSAALGVDATCGNGGDTAFLCRHCARVVGLDVQQAAIDSTRRRLEGAGLADRAQLVCDSHENLLRYVAPGTADAVMFNFGWLPGAEHTVFSTAQTSIPALEAALTALRPGGWLSAILYSGRVIGTDEKQTLLAWMRALPLKDFTVLVCDFANWAETAPLPCLICKK